MITVAVAGGFDPVHGGHLAHLLAARELGDRLVVLLNCDDDMRRKKGYCFLPFKDRAAILQELRCVDEVREISDRDGSCGRALAELRPGIFAKGGDRGPTNMPQNELDICRDLGIQIVYGVGGDKVQSSSELVQKAVGKALVINPSDFRHPKWMFQRGP